MKEIRRNINQILLDLPKGTVITSSWLISQGINYRLQHYYTHSPRALIESIGNGAYIIKNHRKELGIEGGLYALQSQLNIDFHLGASSALEIRNARHFVTFSNRNLEIFIPKKATLPKWFGEIFKNKYEAYKTQILPLDLGVESINFRGFSLKVSSTERAILETIFLNNMSLNEIAQVIENMPNLRPKLLQLLLERCTSIRVKRAFLYLSDRQGQAWFRFLDLSKINLGVGKRVITPSGKFDKKYAIIIDDLNRN